MQQPARQLIYFADPMCSWCWGFSPVMARLLGDYGDRLTLHMVMGGLRAGNEAVMDDEQKSFIRNHWEHVAERSGQPFDWAFFERDGFVYDTEPACRAVVVARNMDARLAYAMMHGIQKAFYAEGRDVTSTKVLTEVAEVVGLDRQAFRTAIESDEARTFTAQDFTTTQQVGVPGFPTLLLGDEGEQLTVLANGYQAYDGIAARLSAELDMQSPQHAS